MKRLHYSLCQESEASAVDEFRLVVAILRTFSKVDTCSFSFYAERVVCKTPNQ